MGLQTKSIKARVSANGHPSVIDDVPAVSIPQGREELALLYLQLVFRHMPPDAFISVSFAQRGGDKLMNWQTRFYQPDQLAEAARAVAHAESEVFARIPPLKERPVTGRGKAELSLGSGVLWCDIDSVADIDAEVRRLNAYQYPPTLIVLSGRGIHAYWFLSRFETALADIKARNKGLAQALNGGSTDDSVSDSVYDLARVMRVPGSFNLKGGFPKSVTIREYHPSRIYDLQQLPAAVMSATEEEGNIETWAEEPLPENFIDELRAKDKKLVDRMLSEEAARRAGATPRSGDASRVDRSANDMHIAIRLLALGYTPGVVLAALTHPDWFSGSRVREQKRYDYAITTVNRAAARVGDSPSRYFEGRRFQPSVLAAELLGEGHYLYTAERLYRYADGVYVSSGEVPLYKKIQQKLGKQWKMAYATEVVTWISQQTSVDVKDVNRYRNMVNVKNGMIDLHTGELLPHSPEYLSLVQLPAVYDPTADTSTIDKFISDIIPADTIPVYWEFLGSCLITDRYFPKASLTFVGRPDAGKSKLMEFTTILLGGDANVSALSLQDVADNRFMKVELFGKLANIFADLDESEAQNTGQIKALTGGDNVNADRKHKGTVTFKNAARFIFSANHYPKVKNPDDAYFDRATIIPCPNQFRGNRQDNNIIAKVTTPECLSGALRRMLEGLARLQAQHGLSQSDTIDRERLLYRAVVDSVTAFFNSETVADEEALIPKQLAYATYSSWCKNNGRSPVSDWRFYERAKDLQSGLQFGEKYARMKNGKQQHCYTGRKLTSSMFLVELSRN